MSFFKRDVPVTAPAPAPLPVAGPVKTTEVFTPSVPALRGFVGRKREMKDLAKWGLRVPGMQVIVWGESGAGKSSLVNKVLEDQRRAAVRTACTPDSTYEGILAAAFSGTGAFTVVEKSEHIDSNASLEGTVGSDLIGAKVASKLEQNESDTVTREPIVKAQLTPQRLLEELGKRDMSWVIEDFHKVAIDVRISIAHALKLFSDQGGKYPKTTIIILGVSTSVDDLLAKPANLKGRLIDIRVPPLGHDELGKILDVGEKLLNLDFSIVRDRLLTTSVGTASITHALALSCCAEHDIEEAVSETVQFSVEDYDEALEGYIRTRGGNLRPRFLSALKVKRTRKYKNTEIILRALTTFPEEGATVNQLFATIREEYPKYPRGNLTGYLQELQGEERGALIRRTEADLYRYDEPLEHAFAMAYFRPDIAEPPGQGASESNVTMSAWTAALNEFLSGLDFRAAIQVELEDFEEENGSDDGDDEDDEAGQPNEE